MGETQRERETCMQTHTLCLRSLSEVESSDSQCEKGFKTRTLSSWRTRVLSHASARSPPLSLPRPLPGTPLSSHPHTHAHAFLLTHSAPPHICPHSCCYMHQFRKTGRAKGKGALPRRRPFLQRASPTISLRPCRLGSPTCLTVQPSVCLPACPPVCLSPFPPLAACATLPLLKALGAIHSPLSFTTPSQPRADTQCRGGDFEDKGA